MGWDLLLRFIIGLGFTMQIYYYSEICKNYFKIVERKKKKDWNDMAVDVVQCECSNIERYASAFSNI